MLRPTCSTQLKHNILQTCCLSRRPMNARRRPSSRDICCVQNKIPHLPIENISRSPIQIRGVVFIGIDKSKSGETGSGFYGRWVGCVADQVGVVVIYDRGGNEVGSGWEVDDCGSGGGGRAAFAATTTGGNRGVDGCSIVCRTVALEHIQSTYIKLQE